MTRLLACLLLLPVIASAIFSSSSVRAVDCNLDFIELTSQAEVDNFQSMYGPCDAAKTIWIRDLPSSYSLNDIDALTDIKQLDGLAGLKNIVSFYAFDNPKLINVDGLSDTESIFIFKVDGGNDALQSLDGIAHLESLGSLSITDNQSLKTLPNFSRLSVGGEFYFVRTALENLNGLSALERIVNYSALGMCCTGPTLRAFENANLTDCSALGPVLGWPAMPYSSVTDNVEDISYGLFPNVELSGNGLGANDPNDCLDSYSPPDADADGIADSADQCPGTPKEAEVDVRGCERINPAVLLLLLRNNEGNLCSNTPAGEAVDNNGCSNFHEDSDSDGVTDDADLCPDTPSGEPVDGDGCSNSQKDSDSDGVTDDVDPCPDTPSGEAVDSDGCSVSQSDPEAAVKQVYEDDVNALIVSAAGGCTNGGCHGRAGAPGGLRLYGSGENNSVQLNYESFLRYIDSNSADRLMTKISGGSGHGGGRRYRSDSSEYAVIEAWAMSVEALP